MIQYVKNHGGEVTGMRADIKANADAITGKTNDIDLAEIAKSGSTDHLVQGEMVLIFDCGTANDCIDNDGGVDLLEGDGQSYNSMAPATLSFRSTVPLSEFREVRVNREVVDTENYTLKEGSTIVTLKIEYLETLKEGDYEISVVSKRGVLSAGFKVVIPEVNGHGFYYNQPYTGFVSPLGQKVSFFVREDGTFDSITEKGEIETGTYELSENNIVSTNSMGTLNSTISSDGTEIFCNELQVSFKIGDESVAADEDYIYVYKEDLGGYKVTPIDNTKAEYIPIKTGINGYDTVALAELAFNDNDNLIAAPEIPNTVTSIRDCAFLGCASLTSINLPDGVTSIGHFAFSDCASLTNINIPDSVTSIGDNAFSFCTSLTSVNIPDSVTGIGQSAFSRCTALTSIAFEGTVAQWENITKGDYLTLNVPATEVICSDGTVSIQTN